MRATANGRALPLGGAASTEAQTGTAPAVRLLGKYLEQAARGRASDLHFEPGPANLLVRMRVDGRLRELDAPPPSIATAVLARLRLVAGVDLAARRTPQDGRFSFEDRHAGRFDVRAAFLPVVGGEKATLRLLPRARGVTPLEKLGLTVREQNSVERACDSNQGMIVVVGPTGSGKTTTLYSILDRLRRPEWSLATVEDPVELELDGVAQVAVDEEIGRGFAQIIRALLRQDPDVLMVGEIRDPQSARIACRAALTGHRVMTSLHTSDTREAALRLVEMGVADYLVRATVGLLIAQRLVRALCPGCRQERAPSPSEAELFARYGLSKPQQIASPGSCSACDGEGYHGRVPVFEIKAPTEVLAQAGPLAEVPAEVPAELYDAAAVDTEAVEQSSPSLFRAGLNRVAALETTLEEVVLHCPQPPTRTPVGNRFAGRMDSP